MNLTLIRNNFGAGEISPRILGRIESAAYNSGCEILENALPTRGATLRRRPGTYYIGQTKGGLKARLIPFLQTDGTFFIMELTDAKARFINPSHAYVGAPTELTTPWAAADIQGLKFANMKGELYLVHKLYAPRKITYSGGSFSITSPSFTGDRTFASTGNYPSSICFAGGRLWFGPSVNEPKAFWASQIFNPTSGADQFTNFEFGTGLAPEAIYIVESGMSATPAYWIESYLRIAAGTDKAIWMATTDIPTPGNFDLIPAVSSGSADVQGQAFQSLLVYIGANGRSLKGLTYSTEAGGFKQVDLSSLADHILAPSVVEFAVETSPEARLWLIRSDGVLVTYSLDQESGLAGFARHPLSSGLVESVAIARNGYNDQVFLSINRGGTRYVEWIDLAEYDEAADQHYVDFGLHVTQAQKTPTSLTETVPGAGYDLFTLSAHGMDNGQEVRFEAGTGVIPGGAVEGQRYWVVEKTLTTWKVSTSRGGAAALFSTAGTAGYLLQTYSTTVSGLSHLNGYAVDALGDGGVMPSKTVSGGIVTYDQPVGRIHIGLPITTTIKPTAIEIPTQGTGQGKKRKIEKIILRVYKSLGGKVGPSIARLEVIPTLAFGSYVYGEPMEMITGDIEKTFPGSVSSQPPIFIVQDAPLPFNLLAIIPRIQVEEL